MPIPTEEPLPSPRQCERRKLHLVKKKAFTCTLPAVAIFNGKAYCKRDLSWARIKARDDEQVRIEREQLRKEREG